MPSRLTPLVTNQYYHAFNRSINKEPIFIKASSCDRAIQTISYYSFENPPIRLSYFLAQGPHKRNEIMQNVKKNSARLVDIITYCLMPNHYHLLLKQVSEDGISKFISLFQNSYTRYFNTKFLRQGHLFQGQFKVVRIEDNEQLIHVHRYIHLNPHTSFVVKTLAYLEKYAYSSLPEYISGNNNDICAKAAILEQFPSISAYKEFLWDQADYQRKLDQVKHLAFE